jgi:60kDa lysophospholipase
MLVSLSNHSLNQRRVLLTDTYMTVATLRLFPGISSAIVRAFLAPPIQGLVLETFGAGNAPQRDDLMREFKDACDRGVVIVAISQCLKGSVSDSYATGRALLQTGVIAGADMTPEVRNVSMSIALLSY